MIFCSQLTSKANAEQACTQTEGILLMATSDTQKMGQRILELKALLQDISKIRSQVGHEYYIQCRQADAILQRALTELEDGHNGALSVLQGTQTRERNELLKRFKQELEEVDQAFSTQQKAIKEQLLKDQQQCKIDFREASEKISSEDKQKTAALDGLLSAGTAKIQDLRNDLKALTGNLAELAKAHGFSLSAPDRMEAVSEKPAGDQPQKIFEQVAQRLERGRQAFQLLRGSLWSRSTGRMPTALAYVFVTVAHVLSLSIAVHLKFGFLVLLGHFPVLGFSFFAINVFKRIGRKYVRIQLLKIYGELIFLEALLDAQEAASKAWVKQISQENLDERISQILEIEDRFKQWAQSKGNEGRDGLLALQAKYQVDRNRIHQARDQALLKIQAAQAKHLGELVRALETKTSSLETDHARLKETADTKKRASHQDLAQRWTRSLEDFFSFGEAAMAAQNAAHPAWTEWTEWKVPLEEAFPSQIPLGRILLDLRALNEQASEEQLLSASRKLQAELPVSLSFPQYGSLLIQAGGGQRGPAMAMLRTTVLRVLASFPPGQARLTLLDPVGLGQSFSGLMQLADHDDSLVGGRILTEPTHIEKRLTEITEHIEKVIQKYLRNRFETIADFNLEAGVMKEPYHFLVLADFPSGFSELALERLASILSSGAKCGVHVLMLHDTRQKFPGRVEPAHFQQNGIILRYQPERCFADHDGLRMGCFEADQAPDPKLAQRMLDAIGRKAFEAKRVEVDFASVAPSDAEMWSMSAENGIRVAVGRSGADRLQYLELGRGTAQHALIAGRTGSGKSTLLHVMITNLGLWFSPDEVELYLIDFKKGVEFKVYAANSLPHARVVAIESDREFGVSVLRRLDKELNRRGEMFRKAGVQDLAAYRRSHPGETLPRVMLVIDEFQEFFTEDDAVSREAELLLDRFVRQGRAFGVHAVLGSQTLSGVFTLAKSTLGQMGVRIALQCNEADSYLILSEDNAAARLLSRPGEAIYNDMSGLVEGNNPFQVVWLPEQAAHRQLGRISEKARAEGWGGSEATFVFEGNAPADLQRNPLLRALLDQDFNPAEILERIWLGEANAIKGPTEAYFSSASGSNLLIVGQRQDAAFALTSAAIISLAASHSPEHLRILILDGCGNDPEHRQHLAQLVHAVPHHLEVVGIHQAAEVMAGLNRTITNHQEGGAGEAGRDGLLPASKSVYMFVVGLQYFRALREDDEFSFATGTSDAAGAAECFANVLREGPLHKIHSVVWCDTLGNLNRTLSRRTLNEFDMRLLFQMSAADSSELIDAPAANRLGLHNALLAVESDGTVEKFRPYTLPDEAFMENVRRALSTRRA